MTFRGSSGRFRCVAAALVGLCVATSACGEPSEPAAVVVEADRLADGSCPTEEASDLIERVRVEDTQMTIWQTESGVTTGYNDWDRFVDVTTDCLDAIAPWLTPALSDFHDKARCELWMHNLAVYALTEDGPVSRVLTGIDRLTGLLGRGRPVDMDVRVWRGEVSARPWDGIVGVCRATRAALPGEWPSN